jgi:dUTP pyrophosphatase
MKAIIPEENIRDGMKPIRTPSEAREMAQKVFETTKKEHEKERVRIADLIDKISEINPEMGGMEELAVMLSLPPEQFAILAPVFLDELEKTYKNVNNQFEMVQMMNVLGFKSEDVNKEYYAVCEAIDLQFADILDGPKRDFIKRILAITYNALAEAEGVGKKTILIPIEYCHEDAKMPAYAHVTDAGMDVFALEDITIMPGETKLIPLGIKVALPKGYELQVRPKSGRCLKTKLRVANAPGTIDAGYRDEICVIIDNIDQFIKHADVGPDGTLCNAKFGSSYTIGKGEKFAQLVLCEVTRALFHEVTDVYAIENDGRSGGFGSTGLK